jgi:hypothetical protein
MNINDFKNHPHLWFRLCYAAQVLPKVQSKYYVVFEDPDDLDAPAKILVPDPNWMAAALAGDVLPDVSCYLEDQKVIAVYESEHGSLEGFSWKEQGGAKNLYGKPRGPMTEEEAIEYLIKMVISPSVWRDYKGNRSIIKIVPVELIPTDRTYRDAWTIAQNDIEMEQAA